MAEEWRPRFVRLRSHTTGDWLAPPELRPLLVADAEREGTNLTEVASRILASRFGVAFEATGRRTAPASDGEELNLRLPASLDRAVAMAAAGNGRSVQKEIIAALAGHYRLEMPARDTVAPAAA